MRGQRVLGCATASAVVAMLLVVVPSTPAFAASIDVTTTADVVDSGDGVVSLREAVSAASASVGDDELVLGTDLVYPLTGCDGPGQEDANVAGDLDHLDATGRLRIDGNGSTIEQTCKGEDERVLDHRGAGMLVLETVTITGGEAGATMTASGGGVRSEGPVTLDGATVANNQVGSTTNELVRGFGGGLHVDGNLTMVDSIITGNVAVTADPDGPLTAIGGGAVVDGAVTMLRSHVDGNEATWSSGGFSLSGDGALTLEESTIDDNVAGYQHGAFTTLNDVFLADASVSGNSSFLHAMQAGSLEAHRSTLDGNTTDIWGVIAAADVELVDSHVTDNSGEVILLIIDQGGSPNLTLTRTDVTGNSTQSSTISVLAIPPTVGEVIVADSNISGNVSVEQHPAPYLDPHESAGLYSEVPVAILRSSISGNTSLGDAADSFAGLSGQSTVTIVESTVQDNVAENAPQAGVSAGGALTVTRSTVAGNAAADVDTSAAGVVGAAHVDVTDSTVTDNAGGKAGVVAGTVDLVHDTIVLNRGRLVSGVAATSLTASANAIGAGGSDAPVCSVPAAATTSGGFNVVQGDGCAFAAASDHLVLSMALGSLTDNGGPTETIMPGSFEGLIPAGRLACLGHDQRGVERPQGFACEPGAVEVDEGPRVPTFSDVGVSHPFFADVECLAMLGATEGYADGTFRPGGNITRQAAVAWLWRLAGEPEPIEPPAYSDVPPDHPFADAIAWASEQDIVVGYPDGTFRPAATITRQAVAAWLWRQSGEPVPGPGAPTFTDVGATHPFHDAISWLAEEGITTGYADGTFRPTNQITRMALAAWVCRDESL